MADEAWELHEIWMKDTLQSPPFDLSKTFVYYWRSYEEETIEVVKIDIDPRFEGWLAHRAVTADDISEYPFLEGAHGHLEYNDKLGVDIIEAGALMLHATSEEAMFNAVKKFTGCPFASKLDPNNLPLYVKKLPEHIVQFFVNLVVRCCPVHGETLALITTTLEENKTLPPPPLNLNHEIRSDKDRDLLAGRDKWRREYEDRQRREYLYMA